MFSKSIFASKTFWLNILFAAPQVLSLLSDNSLIPQQYLPYLAAAQGIVNILVRLATNGPVHLLTPVVAEQATSAAPVVKTPAEAHVPPQQGGYALCTNLLLVAAVAVTALAVVPLIGGCAANSPASAVAETAYSAEVAADEAVRLIPSLLQAKVIDKATAIKILEAADAVYTSANALQNCVTNCSAASLEAALGALQALLPVKPTAASHAFLQPLPNWCGDSCRWQLRDGPNQRATLTT